MTGVIPPRVPKRWVKLIIGVFLIPPALDPYADFFYRLCAHDRAGSVLDYRRILVLFPRSDSLDGGFLRPAASAVALCLRARAHACALGNTPRGESASIQVGSKGGHVLSDRTNTWIALAPYFFPIYSVLAIVHLRSLRTVSRCGALPVALVCGHWRYLGDAHVVYLLDDPEGPA